MLGLTAKDKQLLLEGLRTDGKQEAFQPFLDYPPNWNQILPAAQRLGVAAQLYFSLSKSQYSPPMPYPIEDKFKKTLIGQQAGNMKLFVKLKEILDTFAEQGIPVIVLKGAALAQLVYAHLGFRPMGDIDLLVQHHDLTKAENLLISLNFKPTQADKSAEWYRLNHHHLIPYRSLEGFSPVELHHHIIPPEDPISFPIQELWARARPTEIDGSPCLILSPEDFIFHLCHHLSSRNHFLGQLRGLCDLATLINRYDPEINWDQLLHIGHQYQSEKILYYSLWLTTNTLHAKVPLKVLGALQASLSCLPFENSWFKPLIHQAIFIHTPSKSLWHEWLLQDTCSDLLSRKGKWKTIKSIMYRTWRRYMHYAHYNIPPETRFTFLYPFFIYPLYLIRKAIGWDPRPRKHLPGKS